MIIRRKPKSTVTALRAPPASRMQSGRARAMRAAAFATAGLATVGLVLTGVFAWGASASTHSVKNRSGMPWANGVYLPNASTASVGAFGAWRGTPVDVATVWPNRSSWNDIVDPAWLYQLWKGAPEKWPSRRRCCPRASGECPSSVRGRLLRFPLAPVRHQYLRLRPRQVDHQAGLGIQRELVHLAGQGPRVLGEVLAADRHLGAEHRAGPEMDWNVNRGVSAGLADPTKAYPGNAYVDTVGVDSYDMWPTATTSAGWNQQLNRTQGLMYWLNFAKAHGKQFAVPEWGNVMPGTVAKGNHAGGDDRAYVSDMLGFFQAHSANLAWESNFQGTITRGTYGTGSQVPKASAAYRAGF